MAVDVYLTFNGNCREAVTFYEKVFSVKNTQSMTFGEAKMDSDYQLPEEAKALIMHTRLSILDSNVMFSDTFPGSPFIIGNNVTLAIVLDDEAKLRAAYEGLKEGGKVVMELQETFWSKCYGAVTDKFGIEWQFNFEEQN